MALTNSQYDTIMRGYDRRQYENYRRQCARTDEIYEKFPRIREIQEAMSACSIRQAERLFDEEPDALEILRQELSSLRAEKEQILKKAGYPVDYMEMQYTCPDCKDTGYVGQKKCHCFRQAEMKYLYAQSNIEEIVTLENFSTFSFEYFDDSSVLPVLGRTVTSMPPIIRTCQEYALNFRKDGKSMLFYGSVGTGKTFLSNCIAKELLDKGFSVIYFTSFQLFELLSGAISGGSENFRQAYEPLLESDLLILDDMGTELSNTFTVSKLFQILNERMLAGKSTIISTNLSLQDFRDIYSERVFSRITSSYTLLKFTGSDIRIRRKIAGSR